MNRARGLVVGLILAVGIGAHAQAPGMPSLWYNPALMMDPAVQKDLHVSQDVAQKAVQAMMQTAMKVGPAAMSAAGGTTPTPAQQKELIAALDRMQKDTTKDLTPAQKARLHEITLQSYGPKALLDPKIGAQVGLTAVQTDKLRTELFKVAHAQAQAMRAQNGGKTGFNLQAIQETAKKGRTQSEAVLARVLTPVQRAKWKNLQGRPITLGPLASMMGG